MHLVIHTGKKSFTCDICQKSFIQSAHLKTHSLTHTKIKDFKCKKCTKQFSQSAHLKTHTKTHAEKREKNYNCTFKEKIDGWDVECGKSFETAGTLKTHVLTHSGEKNVKCLICDQRFKLKGNLKRHMSNIHKQTVETLENITFVDCA